MECSETYGPEVAFCAKDGSGLVVVLPDMIGKKLGSHYTIVEELGKGGMGAIYKAHHGLMDRHVAIKLLLTGAGSDPTSMERFLVEARAASILSHPNIVKIFEFDVTPDGLPFLIMEYLEGDTLSNLLESKGRLPIERALRIFIELCGALEHAHKRNVVHRDLKPSNIMLIPDDDGSERSMLVDFGIAKLFAQPGRNERRLTQTGEVFGSPLYMSPEQCMGREVTPKSDIYSFGCVMYEALTGVPPIEGENFLALVYAHLNDKPLPFAQVCPDISLPLELEAMIMRTLNKSADDRYGSMAELKRDLGNFLTKHLQQVSTTSDTPAPPPTAIHPDEKTLLRSEDSKLNELIEKAQSGETDAQNQLGYFYYAGQFVEQDYDLAMHWLKKASDKNNMLASYWIATMYRDGKGVEQNDEQALHYYRLAAELGDDVSQAMVGFLYELGQGVGQDLDLAYYWYKKAADQNNSTAMRNLALLHKNGKGVDIDLKKAAEYFLKAAQAGNVEAQLEAGNICMQGLGIEKDEEEAAAWYLSAGQQGSAAGKRLLAYCYLDGTGVPKDELESFRWMKEAAAESDAEAQSYLAYFYEVGLNGLEPDLPLAFKWYSKSALKKHTEAQYKLGCMCRDGRGTTKNMTQAASWFLRAAEQGQKNAQFELALAHRDGTGVQKNMDEYDLWLHRSAEQGLPEAEYELGAHYEVVGKDLQQARQWYEKAANHGDKLAKTRLLQLG